MNDFIRADAWIGLCDLIDELGGDSAAVLAASGLSNEDLLPVERYHPMGRFIATLNHAVVSTGRKDFGLQLGLRRPFTQIGVVGLALENGSSWRAVSDIAAKIAHITNPLVRYSIEPAALPGAEFLWVDDTAATTPNREQGVERSVAFTCFNARRLVRPLLIPHAVHFRHARIAEMEAYVAALGVAPIFNQPKTGLIIATEDLDRSIPSRSEKLGSLAISYLEENGLIEQNDLMRAARLTARSLVELSEGSAEALSRALNVEKRTLQRQLKKDDSSIEGILDDARRSLVERLLADNVHSLTEITHLLGYASTATLTRNCKRWFGDTPANLLGQPSRSIA